MGVRVASPWVVLPMLLVTGCAARLPDAARPGDVTPAMLTQGDPLIQGLTVPPLPVVDILGVDDSMRRFIAERVLPGGSSSWRLHGLLRTLIKDEGFRIEYQERTYTAAEAFRLRRANCLAFTNLFVALAREAGLTVHFQEVDVPADWSQSGDLLIQNRHINTFVEIGIEGVQIVDFNMADFRGSYDRRVVSDARAEAHYYSNVAVERMEAGESVAALLNFRLAIAADATFVPAWINLGALYQRAGYSDWAEAAWRQALTVDGREAVAMSNLERLYRAQGRTAEALEFRRQIERYREQNPYFRYQLAQAAYQQQNYRDAIAHLRFAVGKKPNEDRFLALLGLAYLRHGDAASARKWMARAEQVAGDETLKNAYHSKLELLRRADAG